MVDLELRFAQLEEKLRQTAPGYDADRLRSAFEFAAKAHDGQKRKTGEPFIIHPVETAHIVAEMGLDLDAVIAALLHDTIEDTSVTYAHIAERFGKSVAAMVDGVTKLTRVAFNSKEEEQMENLRKMFLAMARDIRVIMIKIADRLHNMRTLEYQSENKQREKALETMEVYAPLAHRLGMQRIKWELEDRSLRFLDPVGYNEIMEELGRKSSSNETFMEQIQARIQERLKQAGIKASIYGRIKHAYSIYRKMYNQHKSIEEIYDLFAVRVIVDTIADCYNVMGIIHDLYRPIPGRFKDYISTPKPNMYQSLHTTVIGREGTPFEVQIRTWEMHHTAEYGIAAHWKYKEGVQGSDSEMDKKLEWVRSLLETQQDTDAEDFIHRLKIDMFADDVFVFTPKGDVINLPAGATPIDFAYAIHSEVGNHMTGAKLNGRIVNFDYNLQNGDIIEIITAGHSTGPSRDWLKIAKTSEARSKIKQWFKRERREENIINGRNDFDREMKRLGVPMSAILGEEVLPVLLRRLSFNSLDELYSAIGYGGIAASKAVGRIRDELMRMSRLQKQEEEKAAHVQRKPKKTSSGIVVEELDNCLIKFARCCTPVPGDDVVGFITRGYGVSVHRSDCPNAAPALRREDPGRWVNVHWADSIQESYSTSLQVTARNRDGLVVDVASALSGMKISLRGLSARELGDGYAVVYVVLDVRDTKELSSVVNALNRIPNVVEVKRQSE